jgi:probable HAF family extracellular repeat protein
MAASPASAEPLYHIIDLGVPSGAIMSEATSINDNGQIVGGAEYLSSSGSYYQAVLFDATGEGNNIALGTLGGDDSRALSINNTGQIVGYSEISPGIYHAALFDPTGRGNNIDLGTFGGHSSKAYCINDLGQIVGYARNSWSDSRATLFDPTGQGNNLDLGPACAWHINNHGQIVGHYDNSYQWRAMLFDQTGDGNNIDLGPGSAKCINEKGQIVGYSHGSGSGRAILYDTSGQGHNIDLGRSQAYCINDHGQIVGYSSGHSGNNPAVLFDPSGKGKNLDLNTVIDSNEWFLERAKAINNNGWIVGRGRNPAGEYHAYLLVPKDVPIIKANVDFVPKVLNLQSKGKWITSYIWLPKEYDVADIEPNSIFLEDEIKPDEFSVDEQQQVATAVFNREEVQTILEVGDIDLTITGRLTDGTLFQAADKIKVVDKTGRKSPN